MELGRIFRKNGCHTSVAGTLPEGPGSSWHQTVPGTCESACTLAFLGGVKRSVSAGELGIHQFYSDAELPADARELAFQMGMSEAQFLQGLVIAYLQEMNVEPGLAAAAARVPPEEMHYITEQEIVDWRLDTDRPRTTPWIIEPYKNGAVFTSSEEDAFYEVTSTIYCRAASSRPTAYLLLSRRLLRGEGGDFTPYDPIKLSVGDEQMAAIDVHCQGCRNITNSSYELPLPNAFIAAMLAGSTVSAEIPLSHAEDWMVGRSATLSLSERASLALVLRNCI
jgi:hypothetical protein